MPPLWQIAFENNSHEGSAALCNATLHAPADSPNKEILSGSPPKSWILFFTHSIAIHRSISPSFPVEEILPSVTSSSFKNPNGPSR
jgi:hypothetical protein